MATNGYIVDYSIKKGWFSDLDAWERKRGLMTQAQLADILSSKPLYAVWQATFVTLDEYRANHDPTTYEDMTQGAAL